jgi:hypothetical protein
MYEHLVSFRLLVILGTLIVLYLRTNKAGMFRIIFILFLFPPYFLFCQTASIPEKEMTPFVKKLFLSEKGTFQAPLLGSTKKEVKKREQHSLTYEDDSTLLYKIGFQDSDSVEMVYYFDQNGLCKSFVIAYVLNEEEDEQRLNHSLCEFYGKELGPSRELDNSRRKWVSNKGYQIEMTFLQDESGSGTEIIYTPTVNLQ